MAFRKKWNHLMTFDPDLMVIQECEHPSKYHPSQEIPGINQFLWIGDNPNKGLGIVSLKQYQIEVLPDYKSEFKYILPVQLKGGPTINLFAVWAMPHPKSKLKSYVGQVWTAMQHYSELLKEPSIIIGDLNSNAQWDKERKVGNHSQLKEFLKQYEIKSLYHQQTAELHGKETEPTLYLLKQESKPFHLDYCFASEELIHTGTSIEIGKRNQWILHSDHMPLFISDVG